MIKLNTIIKKVKRKGLKGTCKALSKRVSMVLGDGTEILLLTNRDSDNLGDQVIEACDISLLEAVMKNLNKSCQINSYAAAVVSQKYLKTKNVKLLENAESLIKQSDVVVFGGAPMFNYLYQNFYERTAVALEIAQKYNKPVIFSAIGIEGYDENNKRCQRLKTTLNFDCVKQITTRDDFPLLQMYKTNPQMRVDKVSDPAVFCSEIFEKYKVKKNPDAKKKIGIFVLRQGGFIDNKINFSKDEAAKLWLDMIAELSSKGYDYELVTSGHFGDEAFLDYLIREYNVSPNKCVFNMNSPERLVKKISSYDAVISCRLHPSIIAFSLDVPSLGIVWNPKVNGFYSSIGYEDRIVDVENGVTAKSLVSKVEQIIEEGVNKNEEFLMSVYNSLFYGIKDALGLADKDISPYNYTELVKNLPRYQKVSYKEKEERLKRKFRRTYKTCNERFEKNISLQKKIKKLEEENKELKEQIMKDNLV